MHGSKNVKKIVAINYAVRYRQTYLAFLTSQFIVFFSSLYRLNLLWGLPILILGWSSERKTGRTVKLSFHIECETECSRPFNSEVTCAQICTIRPSNTS